jgi:hypothetical protein
MKTLGLITNREGRSAFPAKPDSVCRATRFIILQDRTLWKTESQEEGVAR